MALPRVTDWNTRKPEKEKVFAFLMESGLFTKRQAGNLAFHLSELLEAGSNLRQITDRLVAGIAEAKTDASRLDDAVHDMAGEMIHIIYHARLARRCLARLATLTRTLPPLRGMSDYQITLRAMRQWNSWIARDKDKWMAAAKRESTSGGRLSRRVRKLKRTRSKS